MAELLVNIDVDDLPKAIGFYSAAFGLKVGRRFGASGVEMLGSTAPIYLLVKGNGSVAAPGIRRRRDYRRHWTPVHLDFVVDDLEAAVARATAAGAELEAPVKPGNWGDLALMRDPFGHGFCLIQFRNRGYDEIAT
jgi:predicted enzyme related to lactoylglutathione lyase